MPGVVGSALDPVIGLLGDTPRRRALMQAGGIAFGLSAVLTSVSFGFRMLLVALVIGNPATGAFVSLAQATVVDAAADRDRAMARWTIAGSVGYVVGPVLIAGGVATGIGWRGVALLLGLVAFALVVALRHVPVAEPTAAEGAPGLARLLAALRDREVVRWLAVLEATDLLGDVLHGFIALYFVDVAGTSPVAAAFAVATWTGAAFAGDVLLLAILARIDGDTYLRGSAIAALVAYPLFLLAPGTTQKLVLLAALGLLNAGWYAVPKARLYAALPGQSGTAVAVGGIGGLAGALVPAALGFAAQSFGLGATMWVLLVAPLALLAGLRRR